MVRKHVFTFLLLTAIAFLVAAWALSFFVAIGFGTRSGKFDHHFAFNDGSVLISQQGNFMAQGAFWRTKPKLSPELAKQMRIVPATPLSARLRFSPSPEGWILEVPIVLLITAIIPLLVGSLYRFRFRLWQIFALTTVVALELAYFSR